MKTSTRPTDEAGPSEVPIPPLGDMGPYPGLRPYEAGEYAWFFGRDRQIDEVITRMAERNFVAILGGSGSGKSSLVRAGVIPQLRIGALPGKGDCWISATLTPGSDPIGALVGALGAVLVTDDSPQSRHSILRDAVTQRDGLSAALETFRDQLSIPNAPAELRKRANLVLLVDQFEELFREENRSSPDIARFVRLITDHHANPNPRLYVVLTMRSESLHHCATFIDLPEALNDASYLVRRLREDELHEIIVEPARYFAGRRELQSNARLDSPAADPIATDVVERLLADARALRDDPDHLPLLQHFLFHIWTAACRREHTPRNHAPSSVTAEDVKAVVGPDFDPSDNVLIAAINHQPDRTFATLAETKGGSRTQHVAEVMFRLMGVLDRNGVYGRRWTTLGEVAQLSGATADDTTRAIHTFATPHPYVRVTGQDLDVSHESLIRKWSRLRTWVQREHRRATAFQDTVGPYSKWREIDIKPFHMLRPSWWLRLLGHRERERALANGLDTLTADWATWYAEGRHSPSDSHPAWYSRFAAMLWWSTWRWRLRWAVPAVIATIALLYANNSVTSMLLTKELQAFHAMALASDSSRQDGSEQPLSIRVTRLLEKLVAVRGVGELPDRTTMSRLYSPEGNDRYLTARRLSESIIHEALRQHLTSGVWTAPPSDIPGRREAMRIETRRCNADAYVYSAPDGRRLWWARSSGASAVYIDPGKTPEDCITEAGLLTTLPPDEEPHFDDELQFMVHGRPKPIAGAEHTWTIWSLTWIPVTRNKPWELLRTSSRRRATYREQDRATDWTDWTIASSGQEHLTISLASESKSTTIPVTVFRDTPLPVETMTSTSSLGTADLRWVDIRRETRRPDQPSPCLPSNDGRGPRPYTVALSPEHCLQITEFKNANLPNGWVLTHLSILRQNVPGAGHTLRTALESYPVRWSRFFGPPLTWATLVSLDDTSLLFYTEDGALFEDRGHSSWIRSACAFLEGASPSLPTELRTSPEYRLLNLARSPLFSRTEEDTTLLAAVMASCERFKPSQPQQSDLQP